MAERIRVLSVDAIQQFRLALLKFVELAGAAMDECRTEVHRTKWYLHYERLVYWQRQVAQRTKELADARGVLMAARFSGTPEARGAAQRALHRAQRRLNLAERQVRQVRHWLAAFDNEATEALAHCQRLSIYLDQDMGKALMHLQQLAASLEAYGEAPPATAENSGQDSDGDDDEH